MTKLDKEIFDDSVLAALPTNDKIKLGVGIAKRSQNTDWIEKVRANNRARAQDPEALARHRATMQSDEYKQAHSAGVNKPGYTEARSNKMKEIWADPEYRELQSERLNDPELKAKQRATRLEREKDPEFKKRHSAAVRAAVKCPKRNATISRKLKAYMESHPERRQELSDRAKRDHAKRTREDYEKFDAKRKANGTWLQGVRQAGKKRRQPLLTPEGVFNSKKEAYLHYGFDPAMVDYNRNKKPNEWFFITVEDYEKCLTNPKHMNKLRKLRASGQYEEVVKQTLTQEQREARCKPIVTPNGVFANISLASDQAKSDGLLNPKVKIRKWVKEFPNDYYYISKEEYQRLKK